MRGNKVRTSAVPTAQAEADLGLAIIPDWQAAETVAKRNGRSHTLSPESQRERANAFRPLTEP